MKIGLATLTLTILTFQCITVIHVIYVLKPGPDSNRSLSVLHILVGVKTSGSHCQ